MFFVFLITSLPCIWAHSASPKQTQLPTKVVDEFIRALLAEDATLLTQLGTDPFYFDNRLVESDEKIHTFWQELLTRDGVHFNRLTLGQVTLMDYANAKKKFGNPPTKAWSKLLLAQCMFAAVTFKEHNGLLLIVAPDTKTGFKVAAITD